MKRLFALLVLGLILVGLPASAVQAATEPKNKGLLITPLREFLRLDAGKAQTGTFTVADLTDKAMTVRLSFKQFSVSDYAYDYRFDDPTNNWLSLSNTEVTLQPYKSQKITYTLTAPLDAAPGGLYYTLFASTSGSSNGDLGQTVQVTTLVYVTINGTLVQTSALKDSSIQRFSFGSDFVYTLDALDTGNVHYFVYTSGKLQGLLTKESAPVTHLLMPGAVRRITGSIPAPILPGVYKATYGYTTDSGHTMTRDSMVVFVPPWSLALLAAAILIGSFVWKRLVNRSSRQQYTRH